MKMRKIIAVLAAMLMLCSIIPMGAMVSAAAKLDNNFDDGTVGKFKCDSVDTIVAEDGAMKWTTQGWKNLYASFSVSANADYKVTFKMKAAAATAMEVKYLNGSWGESGIAKDTINIGTEWQDYTRIINAGSNNALVLLFQSHKATDVYIDDVKVADYVVPVDPVFPENAIYTETFENGSLNGWTSNCSVVSTDGLAATKADGGNFAMDFTSPNYSYTNYKLTVEKNTDYKVIFSVLSNTSGYPLNARVRDGSGDLGYVSYTPSTSVWETHSYLFNSGNNTSVNLRFQAGWSTGTYYLDNICVVPFDRSSMTNDGHVRNGDWETGDATEWANSPNVEVVADPTGAGQGYVIKTFETSSSAVDMFVQEFKNLVVGKEYTLSFKVYGYGTATNNAFFVRFPKEFTTWKVNSTLASASNNNYTPRINVNAMTNAWYDVNITFTAQAATAKVQFMNYRSGQGFYYFDDIALSHAYDAVVTDPDCVNGGYTTYTCACGNSYTDNATAALGHSYNEGICGVCGAEDPNYVPPHTCNVVEQNRVDADCVNDGYIEYACDCGLGAYTETIPALGHTAGAAADCENAQVCTVCGAEMAAALGHDWDDATCTAPKTCSVCGATDGDALGHTPGAAADCVNAQVCTVCGAELEAALGHIYSDCLDVDCDDCGYVRDDAGHTLTYVEAVVPANCQETGHEEYWKCNECNAYFGDAEGSWQVNPAWLNYTGACVRPADAADCAVAPCELCGEDTYGEGEHDVLACQGGTCSKCSEEIEGYGCANYDTPACEDGVCYYCGGFVAGFGHENGSWAACCDGECSYGCGLTYPATEDHIDEDADDYCDNCWNHLNHDVDPCVGGECSICWTWIEGGHTYDNEFDADCNACGEIREVSVEIVSATYNSASEDVRGLATKFDIAVVDLGIADGTTNVVNYEGATVAGYKLISMGAIATNGISAPVTVPCVYLMDLEADSAAFAVRIINIPEGKENAEITFTPYFEVEIDGVKTTIYGEAVTATYGTVIGG